MLKELKDLKAEVEFKKLPGAIKEIEQWNYSEASYQIRPCRDYGRKALRTGLPITSDNWQGLFHFIGWHSSKRQSGTPSYYYTEIFACAVADDPGFYLKLDMNTIENTGQIRNTRHVNSRDLYDTITTLH